MAKRILPLIPPSLVVDHVQQSREAISIDCRFRSTGAKCPDCRKASHRVHSRYERHLADLPWQGRAVTITLHVRRLRCSNERCRRRIFAENVGDVTWRYCRRTRRLGDVHRSIGMALGGEAGMRLVTRLGMPVSADTILRIARTQPSENCEAPRILGVDDWAWRRGQRYGTILVDLETNNVVDLLDVRACARLPYACPESPNCVLKCTWCLELRFIDRIQKEPSLLRGGKPAFKLFCGANLEGVFECAVQMLDADEERFFALFRQFACALTRFECLSRSRSSQNEDAIERLQRRPALRRTACQSAEEFRIAALRSSRNESPNENDVLVLHILDPALAG